MYERDIHAFLRFPLPPGMLDQLKTNLGIGTPSVS